jgi:hypothetical protein
MNNYHNSFKYFSFFFIFVMIFGTGYFLFPNKSEAAEPAQKVITDSIAAADRAASHEQAGSVQNKEANNKIEQQKEAAEKPVPKGAAKVEQTAEGKRSSAKLVASFNGLGAGFRGPQGWIKLRNPSDNSLAVGINYIVQIVNFRTAIYTKKGQKFDTTGRVLYGPVPTNNVFKGFGGACEQSNDGDAVVIYDQLANRWLFVVPVLRRIAKKDGRPLLKAGDPARRSLAVKQKQPGKPVPLFIPPRDTSRQFRRAASSGVNNNGSYAMCYAVSKSPNPLGSYYRYEFIRQHLPDYPRPAVWPDGYYITTSTGDDRGLKQACVIDRKKMLKGEKATEQCVMLKGLNFLVNATLEGKNLPPPGSPNIMMALGGRQLKGDFEDDGIYVWKYHVDWSDPSQTKVKGPKKISVAPYHYLCNGQLMSCVPQPGTDERLDSQGDKLMQQPVYRRIGKQQSIVAVHSVNTSSGGGGVRWYEFRLDQQDDVKLYQQGTYTPDKNYRWLASPAIDKFGNIGIGYSFAGPHHFVGQRFAGRKARDPKGKLTLHEAVLAWGKAAQTHTYRWEDFTQTAVDPSDDCTIWYVGDYYKKDAKSYSTRIGAFRMPGCHQKR